MSIKKAVDNQRVGFVMVDATDFATPETGLTVTGKVRKDGGASATISNTISELTGGQYVVQLNNSETDADILQLRFTATGSAADQFFTFYPESITSITSTVLSDLTAVAGQTTSILVDTGTTLDNKIDSILVDTTSILVDTGTTIPAQNTQILSIASNVLSTIDGPVISDLSNIESIVTAQGTSGTADWSAKEAAQIRSALGVSGAVSALQAYGIKSTVSNILSTIDGPVISDLSNIESIVTAQGTSGTADWSAKEAAQIRSALGVSGAVSALQAYGTNSRLDNATYGLDALESLGSQILTDTGTTLDNKVDSILVDTGTTLENRTVSTLSNINNATFGLDALETLNSLIKSTMDGPIHSTIDKIDSTIDGPVASQLSSIEADTGNILTDTGTTLENRQVSILSNINNATFGLDALETLNSQIKSTIDAPITDFLTSIIDDTSKTVSTLDGPINSMLSSIEAVTDRQEGIIVVATASGSHSTSTMQMSNTVNVNDQYNGRVITFRDDTTTSNLRGQQTDITSTLTANNQVTFTALTDSPVDGDIAEIT